MADLPISKVVLYQNGVGYFERKGKTGLGAVELRVRPDQVNDVLKSLAVLDLSGGAASSVSLPIEKSGDKLSAELPAQVRNATGMLGLLAVLRGAEVAVETASDSYSGRVVGVETPPPVKEDRPHGPMLTLMSGEDRLVQIAVDAIRKVTIGDRALSVGLKQSLDISKSEGAWKPVSLEVRLAGDKTHDLVISYIHEVPVWRPAYRAWVESGKGVQLQGWAVVDNTSGEDWTNVKLSLVVGSPLSFRYNLHTPHSVARPDLSVRLPQNADAPPEPDVGADLAPPPAPAAAPGPVPENSVAAKSFLADSQDLHAADAPAPAASRGLEREEAKKESAGGGGAYKRKAQARGAAAAAVEMDPAEEQRRRDEAIKNVQAMVTGKEIGALYAYEATHPVTVPDRSAALINILNRHLEGKDVFLFREPYSGNAPYRAVMVKNDDAGTLEGGPITLYVDQNFAGEGFIGRVAKGETAFIPYARESGFSVGLTAKEETAEMKLATIVDGRIRIEGKRLNKHTITIESSRDKAGLAYVKLALTSGMTLQNPPKELVKAGSDVYVPVQVPAKGKGETILVEETPVSFEDLELTDRAVEAMTLYLKNVKIADAVKGPIEQLMALRTQLADVQRDSEGLAKQRDLLADEQRRVQGNLDALPLGPVAADLRRQLVGNLEAASRKAAEVSKKLVENEVKVAAIKEKMVVLLRGISLK